MGSCTASPKSRVVPGREMGTSGLDSVQAEVMSLASYLAAPPRGRVMSGVYLSVPPSPCQGEAAARPRRRIAAASAPMATSTPAKPPRNRSGLLPDSSSIHGPNERGDDEPTVGG